MADIKVRMREWQSREAKRERGAICRDERWRVSEYVKEKKEHKEWISALSGASCFRDQRFKWFEDCRIQRILGRKDVYRRYLESIYQNRLTAGDVTFGEGVFRHPTNYLSKENHDWLAKRGHSFVYVEISDSMGLKLRRRFATRHGDRLGHLWGDLDDYVVLGSHLETTSYVEIRMAFFESEGDLLAAMMVFPELGERTVYRSVDNAKVELALRHVPS